MLFCEKYKSKEEDFILHMPLTVDKAANWFEVDDNFYKFLKYLNSKYSSVTWEFLWFKASTFKVKGIEDD